MTSKYRAALLTGISGTAKNQSSATVHIATFFNILKDAAFIAAGGSVSANGQQITVPNAYRFRTDRFNVGLAAGQEYFIQTEMIGVGDVGANMPSGRYAITAMGDLKYNQAAGSSTNHVHSSNWSSVWDLSPTHTGCAGPVAVLGSGTAPVVIIDGDSIICDVANGGGGSSGSDVGDAFGVKNFAKRALNSLGYSFIDVSVPGTNVGNLMGGYDRNGLRASLMRYGSALITDHLHNDRRSGVTFEATASFTEATKATWDSTDLRTRYEWHNRFLRSKLKKGARIIRCTLIPKTTSTDAWATTANQTGSGDDSVWAADYATAVNGDQFKLNDLIMRRGLYTSIGNDKKYPDAGYDLYAAIGGTADGKFPASGSTDGTHTTQTLQIAAAADLAPRLPALLGF